MATKKVEQFNAAEMCCDCHRMDEKIKKICKKYCGKCEDCKAPYIGDNYNWFVWNGTEYIDSGVSAKGIQGDKGDPGVPGERGQQGEKGDKGERGDNGDKGDPGSQGEQGVQGIQGLPGDKGDKGDTGETGPAGESGLVPTLHHANLSATGRLLDIQIKNVHYILKNASTSSLSLYVRANRADLLVDIRVGSIWGTTSDGATMDNTILPQTDTLLDLIVYDNTTETHMAWIRQRDPDTGLWALYEMRLYASAAGARVSVAVYRIYNNVQFN